MPEHSARCVLLAIAMAGLSVACGFHLPTSPSEVPPAEVVSLEVIGPETMPPGESVQFVARLRLSGGTTKSVTSTPDLKWSSSNPSVLSVSDRGLVTSSPSVKGEAVITAEIATRKAIRDTRNVVIVPRPVVTGTFDVTRSGAEPDPLAYVFAVKLTESAGAPASITAVWITFDNGWGNQCSWTAATLAKSRVPAKGTLDLDPLTCSDAGDAFNVEVEVSLKDDSGHETRLTWRRDPMYE